MKISSKTKKWLKYAGIRLSTALLSGVVSFLTSIAGLPECKEGLDE